MYRQHQWRVDMCNKRQRDHKLKASWSWVTNGRVINSYFNQAMKPGMYIVHPESWTQLAPVGQWITRCITAISIGCEREQVNATMCQVVCVRVWGVAVVFKSLHILLILLNTSGITWKTVLLTPLLWDNLTWNMSVDWQGITSSLTRLTTQALDKS